MKATVLKAGKLIETDRIIKRKAIQKMINDITKLPTLEIVRRLYKRHSVGVWEILLAVTWFWVVWEKLN